MTARSDPRRTPARTGRSKTGQERLAAALRANLQRRKAQERARSAGDQAGEETRQSHDSAGIATDKTVR